LSGVACESLLEAPNAQITDILKSLLDHLGRGQAEGLTVAEVLANQCCQARSPHTRQQKWVREMQ